MRTYHIFGTTIDVNRYNNRIAVRGDAGVTALRFTMDRYRGEVDLSQYRCIIKTRDSSDHADVIIPQAEALEKQLNILWVLTENAAYAVGRLEVQLEFHEAGGTGGGTAVWQSQLAYFEVTEGLDAGSIFRQEPTVFRQWEERIGRIYSQVLDGLDKINSLRAELDGLIGDSGLLEIDAKTLEGRRIDDSSQGTDCLWTARKTTDAIAAGLDGIPLAGPSRNGLFSSADKEKLDGLDTALLNVDAKTLNGKAVDDGKSDGTAIWTAQKTAAAIAGAAAGLPLATESTAGLMSGPDKQKLNGISGGGGGVSLEYHRDAKLGDFYKFSDGTLICTRIVTLAATVDKYESAEKDYWMSESIAPGDYPCEFDEIPLVFAQGLNSRVQVLVSGQHSSYDWGSLNLGWNQKLTTRQEVLTYLLAIGRWK